MLQPWSLFFLILIQFAVQFLTSIYLYNYVLHVESDVRIMQKQDILEAEKLIRRKRSSALPMAEDNKVSDTSRVRVVDIPCMKRYILYLHFLYFRFGRKKIR